MQKQENGKSVVHNKPEYADVQCYDGNFTDFTGFSLEAGNRRTPAATFGISAAYFC